MIKSYDWWKEQEMKIKVVLGIIAVFTSLGVGTGAKAVYGFMD
jgi:hypothetical protein